MKARILITDDHPVFRAGLAQLLSGEPDFELIAQCATAEAALDAIHTQHPDVAVLDYSMPGMSGIDIVRILRAGDSQVKCLLLSSFGKPLLVAEALRGGADGYLVKEDAFEEIRAGIRSVLTGGCYVSKGVDAVGLRDAMASLPPTPREREVLSAIVAGESATEIARQLGISPRTVETYRNSLAAKFGARNILELVRNAVSSGFLPTP